MDMKPVETKNSHVEAIGHDPVNSVMYVRYKGGRTYAFPKRTAEEAEAARIADSPGSHLSKHYRGTGEMQIHPIDVPSEPGARHTSPHD